MNSENTLKMSRERIEWIDQLRAFGMLLVIVGHVCVNWGRFQKIIYAFHMPLFFMISGMTFAPKRYSGIKTFAKNKFQKIMLPYFFLNMLVFPIWAYLCITWYGTEYSVYDMILGTLYGNVGIPGYNIMIVSGATWFLPCLFMTEMLAYMCRRVSGEDDKLFLGLLALCGVMGNLHMLSKTERIYPAPWKIQLAFTGVVFFGLGHLLIRYKDQILEPLKKLSIFRYLALCGVSGIVGLIFQYLNRRVSLATDVIGSPIYFYVAALALSFCSILIMMKIPKLRLLTYIGQNTIVWLAFHTIIMRFFTFRYPQIQQVRWMAIALSVGLFVGITPIAWLINRIAPEILGKTRLRNTKQ